MHNLLEYSQNYSMTSRCLWNYYRDQIDDVDDNASDGKSLKYKANIVGKHHKDQRDHHDHHNHQKIQTDINHHDFHNHHNNQHQL